MGKKLKSIICTVVEVDECKNGNVIISFEAELFRDRIVSICVERSKIKTLPKPRNEMKLSCVRDMAYWTGVQIIAYFVLEASLNDEIIISVQRHSREIMIREF